VIENPYEYHYLSRTSNNSIEKIAETLDERLNQTSKESSHNFISEETQQVEDIKQTTRKRFKKRKKRGTYETW
jgi:low affinity Fe/Cu permease